MRRRSAWTESAKRWPGFAPSPPTPGLSMTSSNTSKKPTQKVERIGQRPHFWTGLLSLIFSEFFDFICLVFWKYFNFWLIVTSSTIDKKLVIDRKLVK